MSTPQLRRAQRRHRNCDIGHDVSNGFIAIASIGCMEPRFCWERNRRSPVDSGECSSRTKKRRPIMQNQNKADQQRQNQDQKRDQKSGQQPDRKSEIRKAVEQDRIDPNNPQGQENTEYSGGS
jgi:hypothetical protein